MIIRYESHFVLFLDVPRSSYIFRTRWIASLQGATTHSQSDRIVTARYSAFLFITQFIIFSLLGVIVQISTFSLSLSRITDSDSEGRDAHHSRVLQSRKLSSRCRVTRVRTACSTISRLFPTNCGSSIRFRSAVRYTILPGADEVLFDTKTDNRLI